MPERLAYPKTDGYTRLEEQERLIVVIVSVIVLKCKIWHPNLCSLEEAKLLVEPSHITFARRRSPRLRLEEGGH